MISPAFLFSSRMSTKQSAAPAIAWTTSEGMMLPPNVVTQLLALITRFTPKAS
jgi:hypothetical protein